MALILAMTKKDQIGGAKVGAWREKRFFHDHKGIELAGKTLGVAGFGRIGRRVALLGAAFGMHVIVYDPFARVAGFKQAPHSMNCWMRRHF